MFHKVSYITGGTGFLPSTCVLLMDNSSSGSQKKRLNSFTILAMIDVPLLSYIGSVALITSNYSGA